jgi:hypothetical protein
MVNWFIRFEVVVMVVECGMVGDRLEFNCVIDDMI